MAENLNYNASGSVCYDNKESNCQKYGRLYDWSTAMKACPAGWHLPTDAEWRILELTAEAGGKFKASTSLKAKAGWDWDTDFDKSRNGLDVYGFTALCREVIILVVVVSSAESASWATGGVLMVVFTTIT